MLRFGIIGFGVAIATICGVASGATARDVLRAEAMQSVLESRLDDRQAGDAAIAAFYSERAFAPFWTVGPAEAALRASVAGAQAHALPAATLPDPLAPGAAADEVAAAELALSRAFLRHARRLAGGAVEPRRVADDIQHVPPRPEPLALLHGIEAAADPASFLAGLEPQDEGYAALLQRYAALTALAPDAWGGPVPGGATLREGERSARVPLLRDRLVALGDLPPQPAADPQLLDPALASAIRAFQRRHGLNDDGAAGPRTLEALNTGPRERARQVAVNLERMRWLNRPHAHRRIVVNQPDFTVTLYEGESILFQERVIVGQRSRQTPEFSDRMTHLVFNPSWYVPRSIAVRDILPKLQADPAYLARSNMVLSRGDGGAVPVDPSSHDFGAYSAADFPYRIRQRPDADNALGQVKFIFPNNHAIYLHDTPSRHLFARDSRTFSSGCVRVQDPLRLAEHLLAAQRDAPRGYIDGLLGSGRERFVTLDEPVAVDLVYRTAWVDASGRDQFRDDVYGRDAAVAAAMAAAGVSLPGD